MRINPLEFHVFCICRSGGTGRRRGLKIPRVLHPCGFESHLRHQLCQFLNPEDMLLFMVQLPADIPQEWLDKLAHQELMEKIAIELYEKREGT